MTEQHAKNLYRVFRTQGFQGVCNTCFRVRTCIAHIADLTNECFDCYIKRLAREEQAALEARERQRKRIPLDMGDFCR